jgi:aminomuconate-semialdehyde/2-hydroxymuconate-6-semialdehyde dehydrogenase
MIQLQNYINSKFTEPSLKKYLTSTNPATGLAQAQVPDSDSTDVELAVRAAKAAFPAWSKKTYLERAALLEKVSDLITKNADQLAIDESNDQGKPVWLSRSSDIQRAAYNFRFFAGVIRHRLETTARMDSSTLNYVSRQPIGVAALISPWNLPLYLLTWKIAPAIATGNTVVCKPSELTSLTAFRLCELLNEAGLPEGVVNMVFGTGAIAGQALVAHPDVRLISFTGGTKTGESIAKTAALSFKKTSLELGGKNANIIFADCNIDQAVETSIRSSFQNQGEICLCGSRIFIEKKIYPEFLKRFVEKTKQVKVGNPLDESSFMGPLVSSEHRDKVESYLRLALSEGAKSEIGGDRPKLAAPFDNGYFLNPTVITGVKRDSRLQQEEIFGPVVTVTPFESADEAIELANDTIYGLSATVWTKDLTRAMAVSEKLQVGTVWVNTWMQRDLRMPFGGVKASGQGREGQEGSIEFFTEAKMICLRHGEV